MRKSKSENRGENQWLVISQGCTSRPCRREPSPRLGAAAAAAGSRVLLHLHCVCCTQVGPLLGGWEQRVLAGCRGLGFIREGMRVRGEDWHGPCARTTHTARGTAQWWAAGWRQHGCK